MANTASRSTFTGAQFLIQTSRIAESTTKTFFMYSSKIEKKEVCENFFGVFATRDIAAGEIIFKNWNDSCDTKTRAEVEALAEPYRSTYQKYSTELKEFVYVGPYENEDIESQYDYFINHCCDPNAWMINDGDVAARRDIKTGEQITIDYATFVVNEFEGSRIDPCLCESDVCRGKVSKDDWWQMRHMYRGHYLSWIDQKIKRKEKRR